MKRSVPLAILTALFEPSAACTPNVPPNDSGGPGSQDACVIVIVSADAQDGTSAMDESGGADAVATDVSDDAGGGSDATAEASPGNDSGVTQCSVDGNPGQCMDATACNALPSFVAVSGYCPGAANIQCCVLAPNTSNNPPVPAGWVGVQTVTPEMTAWAVWILNHPDLYPIWTTDLQTFGTTTVMARVEWHPPDFNNSAIHRGVTLYQP